MKHLSFRENELYIDGVKALDITDEMFSPFYVYSKSAILGRISSFKNAFEGLDPIIAYSAKALGNITILGLIRDEGLHIQVSSLGELHRALAAGLSAERIIFGGPCKTDEELSKAIYKKPMLIQVGSLFELEALKKITEEKKSRQNIGLRLNLGIDAGVPPYWAQGNVESRFGINPASYERALKIISEAPGLKLKSVGAHLGSQITSVEPYLEEANALVDLFLQAKANGLEVEYLNIGGGFSIDYEAEEALDINDLATQIVPVLKEVDGKIILEPGRFIVGDSGLLVTQVMGVKSAGDLSYVFVDAGINDLIRPALYEAYHEVVPLLIREGEEITADIVGPLAESIDTLGLARPIVKPRRGEFLAFLNAGAYCSSMASNYGGRRRAAEVLVDEDDFTIIRHRETWEDLYRNDVVD